MQQPVSTDESATPDTPETSVRTFKYTLPDENRPKRLVGIARSDIMFCAVQVIREGGENNLHAHTGMDGLWFVLKGRARFYGKGHELIGEFGPHEGVFVPRNVPYWFESVGPETLEILQAESIDRRGPNKRIDYEPAKSSRTQPRTMP